MTHEQVSFAEVKKKKECSSTEDHIRIMTSVVLLPACDFTRNMLLILISFSFRIIHFYVAISFFHKFWDPNLSPTLSPHSQLLRVIMKNSVELIRACWVTVNIHVLLCTACKCNSHCWSVLLIAVVEQTSTSPTAREPMVKLIQCSEGRSPYGCSTTAPWGHDACFYRIWKEESIGLDKMST